MGTERKAKKEKELLNEFDNHSKGKHFHVFKKGSINFKLVGTFMFTMQQFV